MTWHAYEVVFHLCAPLHSGWRTMGNVRMTRPYVTGRSFWGALTERLTRDATSGAATDSERYHEIGRQVHNNLAFTYFYVALGAGDHYATVWPWGESESAYRRRFLSSYASMALTYPQQSAAEGLLHEVESICPRTLDDGQPIFLKGYLFERQGCDLAWRQALERLQLGGERGYGWGNLKCARLAPIADNCLFDKATFDGSGARPVIQLAERAPLLAHTAPHGVTATGPVEPLVGREWQQHPGQLVVCSGVYFAPGALVQQPAAFEVHALGIWHPVKG